jgi:hypothetical protein
MNICEKELLLIPCHNKKWRHWSLYAVIYPDRLVSG